MATGYVVSSLKGAAVTHFLKKSSLACEQLKNYCPVSNISFISKLIERVVAQRLDTQLVHEGFTRPFQSAYKKFHSTETASLRVQNDLPQAMDCKPCALLVLLDLSAAFDTVLHDVLLRRLNTRMGIGGQALNWFKSYLSHRLQFIKLVSKRSPLMIVESGVRRDQSWGQFYFRLHITPWKTCA